MTKLIDADKLKRELEVTQYNDIDDLVRTEKLIDNAPTVEPKKGEWIEVEPHQSDLEEGIDYREECSICHEPNRHYGLDKYYNISFVTYYKTNFCPNCGADMREVTKND